MSAPADRPPGRDVSVRGDDVFLVSYPRSGNTWMRFMLANLQHGPGADVSFANIRELSRDIYDSSRAELDRDSSPRLLKSHEPHHARYGRIIYLVRDPRDVAASYLAYLVKMRYLSPEHPPTDFVRRFVAGTLDPFGTWRDHVEGWLRARGGDARFVLLRCEDLRSDPFAGLAAAASLMGVPADDLRIQQAVESSDLAAMRRNERETAHLSGLRDSRPEIDSIREGRVGGGADELPPEAIETIEGAWGEPMATYGYVA